VHGMQVYVKLGPFVSGKYSIGHDRPTKYRLGHVKSGRSFQAKLELDRTL
jgi:hypothetical protein